MLGRGLLFTCLLVAARLALPLPLTQVVERSTSPAVESGPVGSVTLMSASFVSLALLAGLAEYRQRLAFAHFAGRSVSDARAQALAHVQQVAEDPERAADATTQVIGDSARIKQGLKGVLNHITVNALLVVGVCAALAVVDVRIGLLQLGGAFLLGLAAVIGAMGVSVVATEHRDGEIAVASAVRRLLVRRPASDGAAAVSALREYDQASGVADIGITRREALTTWVAHLLLVGTAATVLVIGVQATQDGRMTTPALFTVMAYLLVMHGPAVRLARQITRIAPLLVSARQLGAVLVASASDDAPDGSSQASVRSVRSHRASSAGRRLGRR